MTEGSNVTGNTMSARIVKIKIISAADLQLVTGPPLVFPSAPPQLPQPPNPAVPVVLPPTPSPQGLLTNSSPHKDNDQSTEGVGNDNESLPTSKSKKSKKRVADTVLGGGFEQGSTDGRRRSKRHRGGK